MGGRDDLRPYQRVLDLVAGECGVALAIATRPRLTAELDRAAHAGGCDSIEQYIDLLSSPGHGAAMTALVRRLVIGETHFFRNVPQFRALEQQILPELLAAARARAPVGELPRLRIWSAGCATGEEPYSIAILLLEANLSPDSWMLEVIGTDVHDEWLQAAARGYYSRRSVERETSLERRARFFAARDDGYQLNETVRSLVSFRAGNVLRDAPPFQDCDLVLCRNVTIYFRDQEAMAASKRLAGALTPGGFLLTGHAETIDREALGVVAAGHPEAFAYRRLTSSARAARREDDIVGDTRPPRWGVQIGPAAPPNESDTMPLVPLLLPAAPLDPADHLRRGIQLTRAGEVDGAIEELRRCIALSPDLIGARFLLATVFQRAGRRVDSRREYRAVARSLRDADPASPVAGADGFDAKTLLNAARRGLSAS